MKDFLKKYRTLILCRCGCGEFIYNYDKRGRKREYKNHHGKLNTTLSNETKELISIMKTNPSQLTREKMSMAKSGIFGNREKIKKKLIESYGCKCSNCGIIGTPNQIIIHHIDGNDKNNQYNNVILLCRKCHRGEAHYSNRYRIRNEKGRFI